MSVVVEIDDVALQTVGDDPLPHGGLAGRSFPQHLGVVDLAELDVLAGRRRPDPRDAALRAQRVGRAAEQQQEVAPRLEVAARVDRELADQMAVEELGKLGDRRVGACGARSSSRSVSGSTVIRSGADRRALEVMSTIRPSVAEMAGWPSGYSRTARAAALQARANSVSRADSSGDERSRGVLHVGHGHMIRQRIDVHRFRIDGFDDGAGMFAAAVALPRVGEQRLLERLALGVREDLHLRPERIGRMFGGHDRELVGVQPHEVADRKESHQVDEPLQQRLVERRIVPARP